ncbi:hypothetical protein MASR2M18_04290 [Ignavibacteria bacterium]|nr:hypothetical protein [Bacteroidota bacterium]MCZ2133796.1 hypothetical protein [Bacteroidota bacterium]
MKTSIAFLLVLFAAVTLLAAQATFDYVTAKSDGKSITVEWRTESESGVANFAVERAADGVLFSTVSTLEARGSQTVYRYVDEDALMKGNNDAAGKKYVYRIKIIGGDNSVTYSNSINVTHNISGIRRTWGMIKEMFR